ncbi:AzlD domain-containing protein [Halobacteria archaeon AArc-dxtr1]|nr:AzlD domain-containing protein [Halobacteria archaeon AArc-dxtr1]
MRSEWIRTGTETIPAIGSGALSLDPLVVFVIFLMTVATIITKMGGLWLVSHVELSDRVEAGISVLPGAIIVAILGPELAAGGPAAWGAAGVTAVVMWRTENILLSLCAGLGAIVLLRSVG